MIDLVVLIDELKKNLERTHIILKIESIINYKTFKIDKIL